MKHCCNDDVLPIEESDPKKLIWVIFESNDERLAKLLFGGLAG